MFFRNSGEDFQFHFPTSNVQHILTSTVVAAYEYRGRAWLITSSLTIKTKGTNDCQCLVSAELCRMIFIPFSLFRTFHSCFFHIAPEAVFLDIPGNWDPPFLQSPSGGRYDQVWPMW